MIVLRRKVFSYREREEQREYGTKSALLGVFAPGAYQAKEAAKYGYDDPEEYKKVRGKYALKGLFTPGTATYIKKKVEKMKKDGKSTKEIRDYLENPSDARIAAGVGEFVSAAGTITAPIATVLGLRDKINKNRANPGKKSSRSED